MTLTLQLLQNEINEWLKNMSLFSYPEKIYFKILKLLNWLCVSVVNSVNDFHFKLLIKKAISFEPLKMGLKIKG